MPFLSMPLVPMTLFAAALSLAPGPVNLIILSTALNHGAGSALRFILGATVGFTVLLLLTGLGLSATDRLPAAALDLISCAGATVILYFGVSLIRARGSVSTGTAPVPTFLQGAALQWLNPKAWVACLGGVAMFNLQGDTAALLRFASLYFIVCFLGIGAWALLGQQLAGLLNSAGKRRLLNLGLGATLSLLALALALDPARRLLIG